MSKQQSRFAFALAVVMTGGWMLLAAPAEAGSVKIVAGTLRQKSDQSRVQKTLAGLDSALAICWRGKRPKTVTVKLVVGARGQVISSRQTTRGPVAQCVAGVLAVQSLVATGARYEVSAQFATSTQTGGNIRAALKPHRARLMTCRERSKASVSGRVVLRFAIEPSGRVVQPTVQSSELRDRAIESCLVDQLGKLRLGRGVTSKRVNYSLSLDFANRRGRVATTAGGGQGDMQPRKDGPLPGRAISQVMEKYKSRFSACYTKQARRNRALAGRVVLRFTVRDDGTVRNVKIRETTLNNAKVERCIVKVGESLRFPGEPGRGATRVWYPFAFSSR